ncbi:MAG TPA: thioesterase family protein [Acidobacteriaceae bacterium]|nr:thioesterase family protein [Acidobacteriaceae bacterium]
MSRHATKAPAIAETRVRVRYAETDQMGVVYHANYLVWFEVGRVELMRARGLNYRRLEEEEGCKIVVVEATARYKAPARYDDELIIQTEVKMVRGPLIRFGYRIVRTDAESTQQLLCEGETLHIVLGRDMKKRTIPEKYAAILHGSASDTNN